MVRLPGHVLPALARATLIRSADARATAAEANQPLTLTIVLKRDDQAGFERYLHDVYNPHSKNFHHFLTQEEISGKFGPTRKAYKAVLSYLHANGFELIDGSRNRLTLTVRGTRAAAEHAFKVEIADYRIGTNTFHANAMDPVLPYEIASKVQAVTGLANLAQPRNGYQNIVAPVLCAFKSLVCLPFTKEAQATYDKINEACVTAAKAATGANADALIAAINTAINNAIEHYCPTPTPVSTPAAPVISPRNATVPSSPPTDWLKVDGTGQKIGLLEFDTFQTSDVADFLSYIGAPASRLSQLSQMHVNGGATPGANQAEVLLDIDTALTIASGASTVVYDAPFAGPGAIFQSLFNAAIDDGATIISNSWAYSSLAAASGSTAQYLGATATVSFNVTAPPTTIPTFTPRPTGTATSTPEPTPTHTPIPTPISTHTPLRTPTPTSSHTPTPTPTPTPRECIATTPVPTVPVPTPTPLPGHPRITVVQNPVRAGASFTIQGSGFTKGTEVNFFVSTPTGAINEGPLKPSASSTSTQLVVPVPSTITLGQGFVSVVAVNTDAGFVQSNPGFALLQGSAGAGLPSIAGLDGHPLAATSLDPDYAVANVETTLLQGSSVVINGTGFDTVHGAAVDVFCACTGGKLPTTFLAPGNPNLKTNSITFTLPLTTPTGPESIIVSNAAGGSYSAKSNAVSVPLGARIIVTDEVQTGTTLTVDGAGFSTLTVINLFNAHGATVVNLGGLNALGMPRIPIKLINSTKFTITLPAGAIPGAAFIEVLNPPFLAFTSSGNDPCGAFTLK